MSPKLSDLFLGSQSDDRLVALAREGHERAFAVIVERYRGELYAFARRLRSDGRAEDLVQQTFLSAFAALRTGAEVTHLRGWLYQILRNAAISAGKRPNAEIALQPAMLASEPLEDTVARRMQAFDVLAEVAALPGRQRDALVATALNGRSRASVAASMGLSDGAVRQLMHRARAALRTSVTAVTPWPLARWLATAPTGSAGDRVSELALGAGTAGAGGVALKLGAVVASGVVATGIVSSQLNRHHAARHVRSGVPPAHGAAPDRTGAVGAAQTSTASAAAGAPAVVAAALSEHRSRSPVGSKREHSGGGDGGRSTGGDSGRSPGGPVPRGRDGGGSSSGGSGDGGSSSGGSDRGGRGAPSSSTTGSYGRSSTMTSATASRASSGDNHDGGGGSGSSDSGSGGGSGPSSPVPSPSSDSGSTGGPGSSGDSGSGQSLVLSGTSGLGGT